MLHGLITGYGTIELFLDHERHLHDKRISKKVGLGGSGTK